MVLEVRISYGLPLLLLFSSSLEGPLKGPIVDFTHLGEELIRDGVADGSVESRRVECENRAFANGDNMVASRVGNGCQERHGEELDRTRRHDAELNL